MVQLWLGVLLPTNHFSAEPWATRDNRALSLAFVIAYENQEQQLIVEVAG